ncbi:Actin-like ATPase involved in cell morphogenesis [Halogranum gelatinilyticum]|uniref:Actin-like ATPase involved in cell morphogenesis n=1 Tax=Halogranum gelatinilyticum TaxID=660521 RepID=A0A1G9RHZ2_9EURY|nr:rod shape-determining protein [Halogranum gelatinilyticum]SDM22781.1 Actin-like ATPase involved in cell morphogenesis [Halogranum gelatinilyticum]
MSANGDTEPAAVGVKLGSTRTVVVSEGTGDGAVPEQVVQTLTCLATYEDALTGSERVLYGEDAAREYPDRVQYMLRSGLPEDDDRAELTKRFFSALIEEEGIPEHSGVVYAIPTIDNDAGLDNLAAVIEESGIGSEFVRSYPESLCGAIPAIGDGLEAINDIFVSINLGSTNLEACAYRRGEQLSPFATGAVTGNEVDRHIVNNVEEETQRRVNIDRQTAREYKETHADFVDFDPFTDVIQQPGGGSHEFTIEWAVMDAVDEYLDDVVDEVANRFLAELANDYVRLYRQVLDRPIVLTGGMACIPGLVDEFEERLSEELDREIEATAPEEPSLAAASGAQRIAERLVETN